jgi:Type VI secretion system, TssN
VVELPEGQTLGTLFHYFINFHNTKRSNLSNAPIQFKSNKNKPYGWVFYKFTQSNKKEYLDANKTLTENRVLSNETIYAESYTY